MRARRTYWVLYEMLPKGDSELAELADIWLTTPHWQNNAGAD